MYLGPQLNINLTLCEPNIQKVYDDDFTISTAMDPTIVGFNIEEKRRVRFLPKNLSLVLPDLVWFRVSYCAITDVGRENLKGLSKLRFLFLFGNRIDNVEKDAFGDLVSLEVLSLQDNKIISLHPGIFDPLLNLELLDLQINKISTLNENIFQNLANLNFLYFHYNKLETIPKNLFKHNSKMIEISFYENKIKFIDPNTLHVNHLVNLEYIDFTNNLCVDKRYVAAEFSLMLDDLKQNCNENLKIVESTVKRELNQIILDVITTYV